MQIGDGSSVAQLTGPVAELMAPIALSVGLHAGNRSAATKDDEGGSSKGDVGTRWASEL